ncbi:helix-turn-helix transcriptional regulator [Actinokineospora sp. NBRC 105648]|uniref:helix-turn-helix domain-containing protein n=1 Tax=Actinokineospora sp. NBRC 105648 TaxID=3032206 RepID=UPI002554F08F|nr:helix-turn-helix transcriptional regulator [Actinokineospora sp. NBRC 105648]
MSSGLFELLGLDPDHPEARAAREDDANLAALMRSLYQIRRDLKLSQAEVARRMGTTQSAVSDLERTAGDPHVTTLQRYARAVGAMLKVVAVPVRDGWTEAAHVRASSSVTPRSARVGAVPNRRVRLQVIDNDSAPRSA